MLDPAFVFAAGLLAIGFLLLDHGLARKLQRRLAALEQQQRSQDVTLARTNDLIGALYNRLAALQPGLQAATELTPHLAELRAAAAKLRDFEKLY